MLVSRRERGGLLVLLAIGASALKTHQVEMIDEVPATSGRMPIGLAMHVAAPQNSLRHVYWNDFGLHLFRYFWEESDYYPMFGKMPLPSGLLSEYPNAKTIRTIYAQQTELLMALHDDGHSENLLYPVLHSSGDPSFKISSWGPQNIGLALWNVPHNASEVPRYTFWIAGSESIAEQLKQSGCKKVYTIALGVEDLLLPADAAPKAREEWLQRWLNAEKQKIVRDKKLHQKEQEHMGEEVIAEVSSDDASFNSWVASAFENLTKNLADKFVIYAGSAASYENGQDIMLKAFDRFSSTHADAFLIADWFQPFPKVAESVNRAGSLAKSALRLGGRLSGKGTKYSTFNTAMFENGMLRTGCYDWRSFFDENTDGRMRLGAQPLLGLCGQYDDAEGAEEKNAPVLLLGVYDDIVEVQHALHVADIAVFPARGPLVTPDMSAVQAMATGTPTVVSALKGNAELLDHCYTLTSLGGEGEQASGTSPEAKVEAAEAQGRAAVDELVGVLEQAYADYTQSATPTANTASGRIGAAGAAFVRTHELTTTGMAKRVVEVLQKEGIVPAHGSSAGGESHDVSHGWDVTDAERLLEQGYTFKEREKQRLQQQYSGGATGGGGLPGLEGVTAWQLLLVECCFTFFVGLCLITALASEANARRRVKVRRLLVEIYSKYCPEKVKEADTVMRGYYGCEEALLKALREKYLTGKKTK
jgi:glycosyltransferase involved in cell wall biosynthesis